MASKIYRHGGPIDKIVQIRLSESYKLINDHLNRVYTKTAGVMPPPTQLTNEIIHLLESTGKTIVITSSDH